MSLVESVELSRLGHRPCACAGGEFFPVGSCAGGTAGASVACGFAGTTVAFGGEDGAVVDLGAGRDGVVTLLPWLSELDEWVVEAGLALRDGAPEGAVVVLKSGATACMTVWITFWAARRTSGIAAAAAVAPMPSDAVTAKVTMIAARCREGRRDRVTPPFDGAMRASTSAEGAGASPAPRASISPSSARRCAWSSMPDCCSRSSMEELVMMCSRHSLSIGCEGRRALVFGVASLLQWFCP
jgi:hypothetical protein